VRERHSPTIRITPVSGWTALQLGEVWQRRELMLFLTWRDIKVRYAQTALGVAWAVLQPLALMVVLTVFLGRLAGVPSDGYPYAVFALAGLVVWTFFANAVTGAANSLIGSANLVSRVYFPRLVLPGAALMSFLPDVAIASALLMALMLVYGVSIPVTALLLPVFIAFAMLVAASIGVWLAALNVAYRDVRYAVPFLIQLWLFATPVAYPASLVPDRLRDLLGLNPMAGVVEGFRWALLGQRPPPWGLMAVSGLVAVVVLVTGAFYFRRVEHRFADVI
jgi:lipopolysaccharide transport system permease protein